MELLIFIFNLKQLNNQSYKMSINSGGASSNSRNRKRSLRQDLKRIENSIYDLELSYFQQLTRGGDVMEGWYSQPPVAKRRQSSADEARDDDRNGSIDPKIVEKMLFSKSSLSSPWYEKHGSTSQQQPQQRTPQSASRRRT